MRTGFSGQPEKPDISGLKKRSILTDSRISTARGKVPFYTEPRAHGILHTKNLELADIVFYVIFSRYRFFFENCGNVNRSRIFGVSAVFCLYINVRSVSSVKSSF